MITLKYYWIFYIYCTTASIFSMYLFIHQKYETISLSKFAEEEIIDEFDFVVVGGGTAGAIVAGRLTENTNFTVLLVEGGGGPSMVHDIPLLSPMLQLSPYDWQYQTMSQVNACTALHDKVSYWPMGRMLGGTSRLNYMIYLRGHESDFSDWANGSDWTSDDVLHYFKKSEKQIGPYSSDAVHHNTDGPMYVSNTNFSTGLGKALLSGLKEMNVLIEDLNSLKYSSGSMTTQTLAKNGRRWSTHDALNIWKSRAKKRLFIMQQSSVQRVLMQDGIEATGIEWIDVKGQLRKTKASRAVILAAGAVGTPKILLLSGIGPAEHLQHVGIKCQISLPGVGSNLQDHVTTGLDLILINKTIFPAIKDLLIAPFQYIYSGTGLMTHAGCEAVALLDTLGSKKPDIQLMALPGGISTDGGSFLRWAMNIGDKAWEEYFKRLVGQDQAVSILPTLLHPTSKGWVKLSSSNPFAPPIIQPNYLKSEDDVNTLVRGLQVLEKLVETKAMKSLGARLNKTPMPGCEPFGGLFYWQCYVRALTLTAYHPVGTAALGPDPEKHVVDHHLRVHRTSKLYVVDASVMPNLPSGNTQAAVMMIAEKGADLIKLHQAERSAVCSPQFPPPSVPVTPLLY